MSKRNFHVEFDEQRSSSVFPSQVNEFWLDKRKQQVVGESGELGEAKAQPGTSRSRIAGYLATKLSTLTNLGAQQPGTPTQQAQGPPLSASAPPSPLNKRQRRPTGGGPAAAAASSRFGLFGDQSPLYLAKDYAGCDFVLLLESTSNSGSSGSGSAPQPSAASPLLIHLVAPNLQEKAAWMSDISQVSTNQ